MSLGRRDTGPPDPLWKDLAAVRAGRAEAVPEEGPGVPVPRCDLRGPVLGDLRAGPVEGRGA
ncbi:hypothetical protein AB0H45_14275 [Streptomyces atroolivaceus]|uniref:Uncharacterized protein n=1 Tax=Streptomyces atroolivaceus TaxID=66869 RepID=A0ABV9V695_STRAZ|nr:hypothetical protein [Streptomyces atroolivaceus]